MPTQPLVRSPKCTLPSRPRVMPSARPMYWAKMRHGSTPRMMWAARSRCRMHRRSCGGHRPRRAGGHGLLAEAVVEAPRHLALPVERHRAFFDPPHHQHRAQQPGAVLCRQVLGYVRRYLGSGRFGRHLACLSFAGSVRRPRIAGALRRSRTDGISAAVRSLVSVRHGGLSLTTTMVESVRWRRLRWRLRGAWQWPTFALLTVLDALLVARLPFQGDGRRRARRGAARRASSNLLAVAVARAVRGHGAAPPPPGPAARRSPATTRAPRCS